MQLIDAIPALEQGILTDTAQEALAASSLMHNGPLLEIGRVNIEVGAWLVIPSTMAMLAVNLHWCGIWGAAPVTTRHANDQAVAAGTGQVTSFWHPADTCYPAFWITTTMAGTPETCVYTSFDEVPKGLEAKPFSSEGHSN